MKKLIIALGIIFFCAQSVFANDNQIQANQDINIEDNKAVVTVQKQPTNAESMQKQAVKNNWFCIIIQVNGKIKNTDNAEK